jgi:hypothetical protein
MKLIEPGDIFMLSASDRVYVKNFPKHYLGNCEFDFSLGSGELVLDELAGKFVCTKTELTGGGKNYDGDFPDGHKVTATKIHNYNLTKFEVSFYQTGCFTCMIEPEIIGKAEMKVVIK